MTIRKNTTPRSPIEPGEHLAEELKALDMSASEMARKIDVAPTGLL
jgi:plasmid maintenance system antidote protein VapI